MTFEKQPAVLGAAEFCPSRRKAQANAVLLFVEQTYVDVVLSNVLSRYPVLIPVAL